MLNKYFSVSKVNKYISLFEHFLQILYITHYSKGVKRFRLFKFNIHECMTMIQYLYQFKQQQIWRKCHGEEHCLINGTC